MLLLFMFKFSFGKKKKTHQIILIGLVLSILVGSLSRCSGVPQEGLWDIIDELQRHFFPQSPINDIIINDPKKLDRRIERDVDSAIRRYERLTKDSEPPVVPLPRFTEAPINTELCYTKECQSLGGEIRLCAPWVDNCI